MNALDDYVARARRVRGLTTRPWQFGSRPPAWRLGKRGIALAPALAPLRIAMGANRELSGAIIAHHRTGGRG